MESDYLMENQRYTKTHNMIRWKSGKMVDPKLLALLESFGEIYVERREFFKKIFDEKYEEVFEKIGSGLKRRKKMKKARSMSRSLSMRAMGQRGIDQDVELEGLRLERFKVKTPNVIDVELEGPRLERFKIRPPNAIEVAEDGPTQGQGTQGSSSDSK